MHSHLYCKTLDSVTKEELVNALHQTYLQLKANIHRGPYDSLDNKPALHEGERIMAKAGHIGFTK